MKLNTLACAVTVLTLVTTPAWSAIEFDQDVTNDVIFGTGNDNGSFTTGRNNGVELGLRAKLRHNAAGNPENTFNSNGNGTYSFAAGVAPTQTFPTAVWSFEWSINSDYLNTGATPTRNLNSLSYVLSLDYDPTVGEKFLNFDPINAFNLFNNGVQWDHAIGDNNTPNGGGTSIPNSFSNPTDQAAYATLIDENNLAQNSWKPHWFLPDFDPTVDATYDFRLSAFDGSTLLATSEMQVIVGEGGAAPEPVSLLVWSLLGVGGLAINGRRFHR